MQFTIGTREEVDHIEALADKLGQKLVNHQSHKTDDKGSRLFSVGDTLELYGMEEYTEFNGVHVTVAGFRESSSDDNAYYISSEDPRIERYLNFVWERRLRPISTE